MDRRVSHSKDVDSPQTDIRVYSRSYQKPSRVDGWTCRSVGWNREPRSGPPNAPGWFLTKAQKRFHGGTRDVSNAGATGRRRAREKANLKSRPFTKMHTKWTTDFSVKRKNHAAFRKNTGEILQDLELVQESLGLIPQPQFIEEKKLIHWISFK